MTRSDLKNAVQNGLTAIGACPMAVWNYSDAELHRELEWINRVNKKYTARRAAHVPTKGSPLDEFYL